MIYLVIIYLLSVVSMWNFLRIAHSKDGIWMYVDTSWSDVFITVLPVYNTVGFIVCFIVWSTDKESSTTSFNINKLFNVKK